MKRRKTDHTPTRSDKLRLRFAYILMAISAAILVSVGIVHKAKADYTGPHQLHAPIAIDGDSLRGQIVIWFDQTVEPEIRVFGVDTPEFRSNGGRVVPACEKVLARKATDFVNDWLIKNEPITVSHLKPDMFNGRYDALVTGRTGSLAAALLAAGHARPMKGSARPKEPWCQ